MSWFKFKGKRECIIKLISLMVIFTSTVVRAASVPPSPVKNVYVERVKFKNRYLIEIVADLYLPTNFDKSKKLKAIVVGPPFGSVKEQTSGLYAQKLAEKGYAAMAFDPSYRGESGGQPRQIDSPEARVEDFSAAVDFFSNHSLVDKNQIGVLGVCASGSYAVSATQIDHRIKALATVSMFEIGQARREGVGRTVSYEQRMKQLDELGEQRTREYAGEPRKDVFSIPNQLTGKETPMQKEFYDYYKTPRGRHPRATNSYSFTSMGPLMNFFPFVQIETISPRPLLFIVGEKAESDYFSKEAYEKAKEPKELFTVPKATHVDLYDRPEFMDPVLIKLDEFFTKNLQSKL